MNSEEHFEAIVRDYYQALFKFALRLTHAEADAKDLTQQTFYVWATKGHQLRDVSKLKSWLFTTLHNSFLKEYRKQSKFVCEDLVEVKEHLAAPITSEEHTEDFAEVRQALTQVDAIYRGSVSLFYLHERSYHEIAEILDIPPGTVKSRIARGIAQLREIMLSSERVLPARDHDECQSASEPEKAATPAADFSVVPLSRDRSSPIALSVMALAGA